MAHNGGFDEVERIETQLGSYAGHAVVVASEQLDGESGWRMLAPGELVHVRPDLTVESAVVMTEPPARLVPLSGRNPNIDS